MKCARDIEGERLVESRRSALDGLDDHEGLRSGQFSAQGLPGLDGKDELSHVGPGAGGVCRVAHGELDSAARHCFL